MHNLISALIRTTSRENGQDLAEYALILAFILAVAVVAVTALGLAIAGTFGGVVGSF
jgi:Flp pilus assembly pilin Flp